MKIAFHKNFEKKFKRLDQKIKKLFIKRLKLFTERPFSKELNNHALKGKFMGYRSINVSGDIRAVFKFISDDLVEFDDIDNHSNLYS